MATAAHCLLFKSTGSIACYSPLCQGLARLKCSATSLSTFNGRASFAKRDFSGPKRVPEKISTHFGATFRNFVRSVGTRPRSLWDEQPQNKNPNLRLGFIGAGFLNPGMATVHSVHQRTSLVRWGPRYWLQLTTPPDYLA